MKKLLQTSEDILPFILRVGLGIVILPHGLQKILGIFGGHGPEWTVDYVATMVGYTSINHMACHFR